MNKPASYLSAILVCLLPLTLFGQATITGTVTDAGTGEALAGANVIVEGTDLGAAADASGQYAIENVPAGTQTITASVIGYEESSQTVEVPAEGSVTVDFALETMAIELSSLEVLADRATRNTPVAFTNVEKADMSLRLGSQDIPLVLNTTPSVYATAQGGGAGDARINVRGFDQRNVAILINGIPVNDMENGWVYWSNWDGLGDATSSIQMQRGLSAVNLATPSIGGSMNIITDPALRRAGGMFKQEVGAWGFLKSTLSYHTGLIGDKLALGGTVLRKVGDGYYKGTWTDAWSYYFGASYALTDNDRLEFYALGAPQRHGQNLYKQNIAAYSHDLAEEVFPDSVLNMDEDGNGTADVFDDFPEAGRDYNENVSDVPQDYAGTQYWRMYTVKDGVERFDKSFLNERENYFHKPIANLNWYHTFNDQMRLSSVLYWSGGKGGGTGTYGSMKWDYSGPSRIIDWQATLDRNSTNIDSTYSTSEFRSLGILRNSVNQQWTIGALSKLYYELSDEVRTQVGVDWRTAKIGHWREVRDLAGGDYYVDTYSPSDFWTGDEVMRRLGDKINYYFTNTVDWLGVFGQGEYSSGPISAYGMAGWSTIAYTYVNHFKDAGLAAGGAATGEELTADASATGIQVKGGGLVRLSDNLAVFGNVGYVSKVPIFDAMIDDRSGTVAEDPENEKFTHFEGGANFSGLDGRLSVKANVYNTIWRDRTRNVSVVKEDGTEGFIFLTGMDANYSGLEVESAFRPISLLRLDAAVSIGNWEYIGDMQGSYKDYTGGVEETKTYEFFVKGLKVGDAPQTQISVAATVFPIPGLMAQAVLKSYANHYAAWDPFDRTDAADAGVQSWKIPGYSVVDLHALYDLPIAFGGVRLQAFLHVFNLLDAVYIQDAVDNSRYNAFRDNGKNHAADDAEVFLGLPQYFNAGLTVNF